MVSHYLLARPTLSCRTELVPAPKLLFVQLSLSFKSFCVYVSLLWETVSQLLSGKTHLEDHDEVETLPGGLRGILLNSDSKMSRRSN